MIDVETVVRGSVTSWRRVTDNITAGKMLSALHLVMVVFMVIIYNANKYLSLKRRQQQRRLQSLRHCNHKALRAAQASCNWVQYLFQTSFGLFRKGTAGRERTDETVRQRMEREGEISSPKVKVSRTNTD